ncbi:MAG: hypothetical protein E7375_01720 [Clostridiales bacterium]|nr:hypothetical protein [Clostridiales bacterium]
MLLISVICMLVATFILSVVYCFVKDKTWSFILQIANLITLVCLGITVANYKYSFNIYSIVLIASILPQIFNIRKFPILIRSSSLLLSASCIAFCGIFLGLEVSYGIIIGIAFGLSFMFIALARKKTKNLIPNTLAYLAIGIVLGQILTVLLYSADFQNIAFCLASIVFAIYVWMSHHAYDRFAIFAYYLSILGFFATFAL